MSVINQVLQDLEKRGATVTRDNSDAVTSQVRAVPIHRSSASSAWLYGLVLLCLLAAGGGWFFLRTPFRVSIPDPVPGQPTQPLTSVATSPAVASSDGTTNQSTKLANNASQVAGYPQPSPVNLLDNARAPLPLLSLKLSDLPKAAPAAKPVIAPVAAGNIAATEKTVVKAKPIIIASAPKAVIEPVAPVPDKSVAIKAPASVESADAKQIKQIKQVSLRQRAEHEFRKAAALMQQGRINEALDGYASALQLDAGYEAARQTMVGLLLESKRSGEAERILQEGVRLNPGQTGFVMILSRIQTERGDIATALDTLQKSLPYATNQAEYRAFMGALLQRQSRHKEAVEHYRVAVSLSPGSGVWLMGLGISLQAEGQLAEAHDAFLRARGTNSLSADLQAFVDQRIKQTEK